MKVFGFDRLILALLLLKRGPRILINRVKILFTEVYHKLKMDEIVYFFLFIIGRYSPKQFNPAFITQNLKVLFRLNSGVGLNATRKGELIILDTPWQKARCFLWNTLSFGALQKRVEKIVYYTYLTITLELNNPFNRRILEQFLNKKIELLEKLLDYVKKINGRLWDQRDIRVHIDLFKRNSLFQAEVIRTMHLAVKKQKENALIQEAKSALKKGLYPVLVTIGVSGTYWIRGVDRRILGLFKPFDEEVHAPNNPVGPLFRGALGLRKTRAGCRVGESPHHEVGAFLVDEFFGFGIVPRTYYVEFTHQVFFLARENRFASHRHPKTKYGSFQEFVGGFVSVDKLSREEVLSIPLDEFQLLVVLDVIIGNTDRNIGNILFGDEKIAAIDHGLCFPDKIDDFSYWYWSYFQQGEKPLFEPIIELLNHFPFDTIERKLRKKCFISLNALHRMRERVALFTAAIREGLVPAQLAELFKYPYLAPLMERKSTLPAIAAEQVQIYKKTL